MRPINSVAATITSSPAERRTHRDTGRHAVFIHFLILGSICEGPSVERQKTRRPLHTHNANSDRQPYAVPDDPANVAGAQEARDGDDYATP
jgi:hypothetical protein